MSHDIISRFYLDHLPDAERKGTMLQATCPFCSRDSDSPGTLIVFLNRESYFHGYFRCLNRCIPGGFPLHFAELLGVDADRLPGFDPDREPLTTRIDYPPNNINTDIKKFMGRLTDELRERFKKNGISEEILIEMQIGYNGRYLVYPYFQADNNCYAARCINPDRPEDAFWFGNEVFFEDTFQVFNSSDIECCENGTLFVVEGEDNLLTLKQLGLPGIAVPAAAGFEKLNPTLFSRIRTLFLVARHNPESMQAARALAVRLGYKVRIIRWPERYPRDFSLCRLARDRKEQFQKAVFQLIKKAHSFSPFPTPAREYSLFCEEMKRETEDEYRSMNSGFPKLDLALGGIHGITVMGGPPKAGKSCFYIQIATEMAIRSIPVIYYDFENSRQKIYQRTLCRLSRLSEEQIKSGNYPNDEDKREKNARQVMQRMLSSFRVVTDRKLTPEIMRRHIDFLRHETGNDHTLVVIDSLHKLPFKDLSERRTGIDAWLRQFEAIRDELNVSFLVVSELSRNAEDKFVQKPHLGSFKGSGDIAYSADNALILMPDWNPFDAIETGERTNSLWLVASRENSPGQVAKYRLDYPYWGFEELS